MICYCIHQVASYDFIMPVTINQTGAPTPSSTPFPPTPAPSNINSLQHIIQPRPIQVHIATPRRKVIATALRQPLQLSHHKIDFLLSPISHQLASSSGIGQSKVRENPFLCSSPSLNGNVFYLMKLANVQVVSHWLLCTYVINYRPLLFLLSSFFEFVWYVT